MGMDKKSLFKERSRAKEKKGYNTLPWGEVTVPAWDRPHPSFVLLTPKRPFLIMPTPMTQARHCPNQLGFFNLPTGVLTQSLDGKLWKADLGSPSSCFPIKQHTGRSGSYLCAPAQQTGPCWKTTKPEQAEVSQSTSGFDNFCGETQRKKPVSLALKRHSGLKGATHIG